MERYSFKICRIDFSIAGPTPPESINKEPARKIHGIKACQEFICLILSHEG